MTYLEISVIDKANLTWEVADLLRGDYKQSDYGNLIPQTIKEYFYREAKPHLFDAWIDEKKTKTGYEINFTKYFYEFKPLRSLAEIKTDILAFEESSLELEKTMLED